jgi:hypothetical protein
MPVFGIERVKKIINRANEHLSVEHKRGGFHRPGRLVSPKFLSRGEVEAINIGVAGANKHLAVHDGGGGFHRATGLERPEQFQLVRQFGRSDAEQCRTAAKHGPPIRRPDWHGR